MSEEVGRSDLRILESGSAYAGRDDSSPVTCDQLTPDRPRYFRRRSVSLVRGLRVREALKRRRRYLVMSAATRMTAFQAPKITRCANWAALYYYGGAI